MNIKICKRCNHSQELKGKLYCLKDLNPKYRPNDIVPLCRKIESCDLIEDTPKKMLGDKK
ncbi:MAG: hypothetical protein FWC41_00160 [Firmicutes bacterium]|nr:hypothetical protein [Bacillota bacterium]